MKSGLINRDGKVIECLYYEIENLCREITEQYCLESENNQKEFLNFSKDYTYFTPYFDFVVGVLGYSLINPWLQNNKLLCNIPGTRHYMQKIYSSFTNDYVSYEFGKAKIGFSSDNDLKIEQFSIDKNDYKCLITNELKSLVPIVGGHRELAKQILNLGMIKDKELCEKISLIEFEKRDMAEVLMYYFPLIRYFCEDDEFLALFRSDNISEKQNTLVEEFKIKNREYVLDYCKRSKVEVFDWSYKFLSEERRDENEYRRI